MAESKNTFDNIVYINLDKNIRRDELIKKELDRFNLEYHRVSGVLLSDEDVVGRKSKFYEREINGIKFKFEGLMKSVPVIGCMLAHLSVIKYIKESGMTGNTIVFEDDVSFKYIKDFTGVFNEIISEAPSDFTILKVHCSNFTPLEI